MWTRIVELIFVINSIAVKTIALLFIVFGCYNVIKNSISQNGQETSLVAVVVIIIGTFLSLLCLVKSLRFSIACHVALFSICGSGIWTCMKYSQEFQEFFSHEISILWSLKDSSRLYRKTVEIIQNSVVCCKIHSVVSLCLENCRE